MRKSSRRQFITMSAVAAGSALVVGGRAGAGAALPLHRPGGLPERAASPKLAAVPPLARLDYAQVELLDSVFRTQFEHNHHLFLNLDEDGLLKPFRQRVGLPAPGPDMGGWYDNADDFNPANNFHGFIPGHSFGQYLSGLARAYAVTGSKPTQEKIQRLVRGFAATVDADPAGKFYVGYRLPAYTYDKTSCGLIDAHEFAHDPIAMDVHWKATQAVLPHLPDHALSRYEQRSRGYTDIATTWDETYTLPENLFLAYRRSGNEQYRELGARYLEQNYFEPLSRNANVLPFEHAYSHVNALSSAMQGYLVLGNDMYLRAARNGLRMVEDQSFATGGWGPDEAFVEPGRGGLAASLKATHYSFETPCGAYGHFKITRYLLRVTRDSRYGDSMERVLYNTIGGARLIQPDGTSYYYSDYNNADAKKVWYWSKWPCCSGTFPQLSADYHVSSYFQGADGLYVNLFLPSKVTWTQGGAKCTLTQTTEYPKAATVGMELALDRPEAFALNIRIPAWTTAKTTVSINGKRVENEIVPGKFLALQRTWGNGDRVEVEFEMPLRLEPVAPENPETVALMRGPLAMFAIGQDPSEANRQQLLAAAASSQSSDDWMVSSDRGPVTFRSFMSLKDEPYRLYQVVKA
ncbi:MAG TPA: beta-L-arabinofuranosidase domain-containing protein [Candidatus Acidoferrales bacterium]|nr:beta-L-arabinofuranosidase domain-containing protein [Candidatus Acidoferrales bacterium]